MVGSWSEPQFESQESTTTLTWNNHLLPLQKPALSLDLLRYIWQQSLEAKVIKEMHF